MMTIQHILSDLLSDSMITELSNWLVERDPDFPPVQEACQKAAKTLVNQLGAEAETFLRAQNQQIISDLRYCAYLGFQANLANFRCPGGNHFIAQGSDQFLGEYIMYRLPGRVSYENTVAAFQARHGQSAERQLSAIQDYYIYLETVGPKLAHYWGYIFANQFLPLVEPGYVCDNAQTSVYTMELSRELGFSVK